MNDKEIILKLRNLFDLEENESNERLIDLVDVLISENDRLEDIEESVKAELQSIMRDYRYLSYGNVESFLNKLEELVHRKENL